ncbi:hypothetical protein [Tahibacter sp.]|uniref:hypothetical protein n=1 Tax=Tahibacter sp. TaxID=2056211 RepID=UPI0028C3A700|nr:hypothetical protein [Tahibacter sp.]
MRHSLHCLRFAAPLLAAGLLAACAAAPPRSASPPAAAAGQSDPAATGPGKLGTLAGTAGVAGPQVSNSRASREIQLPAIVVVRRYDDVFSENGANLPVTVEYVWDYARGIGVERVYTRDGQPHSQRDLPEQTMNFTDAEMELAFALAREHAGLGPVLAQHGLRFYGGFAFREATDPGCGQRSRCVHVIVSGGNDGERPVAHAIVDLMKRVVVHPFYGPDNPGPLSQAHP